MAEPSLRENAGLARAEEKEERCRILKEEGPKSYGSMEVESNGGAPTDVRGAGGGGGDTGIELVKTGGDAPTSVESRRCTCREGGIRCAECTAGRPSVQLQLETWSAHKTIAFAVVVGAFAIWAIVFGVCLNLFNL